MAEWLFEQGIGEARAALVEHGRIVEARIERDDGGLRAGAILPARLVRQLIPRRRGIALIEGGHEALVEPLPPGLTEGGGFLALVTREAIAEPGHPKRAKAVAAPADAQPSPGPTLAERLALTDIPVRPLLAHAPDALEAAGWSETLEEAASGDIAFPGGGLRISPTPAMTLIDIDGALDPAALAVAGAGAAGEAIRRLDIGGSIGIDLPTMPDRAARQAAAAALDAALPLPFERTAVNGFGFLQIVRRRERASLPELLRGDPALTAALALLRRAERSGGVGARTLVAASAVVAIIDANRGWIDMLSRRLGAPVALRAEPGLAISAGHVEARPL
ncbi:MAG: ribonuclease [Sphingomonas sanxanigenens]|uniref:Ribonuclease n=1 Tax=Sphingomonas sanxanigenens TaxID=397260 RepID=A0A2W5AEV9_9SPHN|nr:MAG: ribonuclease [Sphingomonas sanxanigenens]